MAVFGAAVAPGLAAERIVAAASRGPAALPDSIALAAVLQDGTAPLIVAGHSLDRTILNTFYQAHGYQPVWTDSRLASFQNAVAEADSHGLEPAAYRVAAAQPVDRELLLSDAFLRYATALARGRVAPQELEADWRIGAPPFDPVKALEGALTGDAGATLTMLAPHSPAYQALRVALHRYEALAQQPWRMLTAHATIRPGDHDDMISGLRERLVAEGYLDAASAAAAADPTRLDDVLSAAVSRFQAAHGLATDGAVGKGTVAALNVSAAQRVKQIRWNLERWRSLPRITVDRRVEVNVPAATAVYYDNGEAAKVMRAIVGAQIHPTPVLRARLVSVLLNPPWIVPSSIIEHEIRPALKKDPKYLQRLNLVYEDINGGNALVQLPGPKNSLGQVKFEMPNPDDIYMHDTPEKRLFELSRRYFSHGCVRVEDPREFARILLGDPWPRETIDAAIAAGQTQRVPLAKSLPVYVLYLTAFVDADGTVEFRDDIYGRDRRLADALSSFTAAEHLAAVEGNHRS